jgi:hypothetical protein
MTLYLITLFAHSYLRWAVLAAVVFVLVRAYLGWRRARAWNRIDERLHVALVGLTDLQFTLGLALYLFMSPLSHSFLSDPASMIAMTVVRFFGLEHPVMMLVAVALVHVGRSRSRKVVTPAVRHRVVFATTLAALLILCASIPWPGLKHGRPLLRGTASVASRPSAATAARPQPSGIAAILTGSRAARTTSSRQQ